MEQNLRKLVFALNYGWSKETSHSSVKEDWCEKNKSLGQCAITSLIVQDFFNGKIISGKIKGYETKHYWNIIDGNEIDLTRSQFKNHFEIEKRKIKKREDLLSNEDTKNRYNILKIKIEEFYSKFNEIEEEIKKCNICKLDKIIGDNIYFGTDTKILIIGEAPAKNGWRITGKAWINEKNRVIPSGKILEKLLVNSKLNLFDISFIELIKCFPENRKLLKTYSLNCNKYLKKQIDLIKPKLIITLGTIPTMSLLNNNKIGKLSDFVGKEFKYENITVIPIFHPSPISPKSFIENKPIFDKTINKYIEEIYKI